MMNLQKKDKASVHFKCAARNKVRELGFEGAVQYTLEKYRYYNNNSRYEDSWIHARVYGMMLEYLVNDLGE